ncbi:phosphatidate cytidylyltransferase [Corynebacterium sp. 320]|uniref:Phosphatidate cytidylyltransferase n=1 Tax=Corynebacterium zhongnanshanii TaxID=2768834 RepID=A0ABQ6VLK5_9CORY|nr:MULTISPECIES: phosphatidate cytidylyltransferase [Corynebacterium]KAB1503813.1 phosphatidate cytidylyltransferase [Corynebacterium sp. 320]KAB1553088.1 phosphatidate cytidylyltransferase [Corynebacterium sp. 321]KAB1553694.1 phosphatidate cytidylyltransferase [Corynebacterium sp. 319]KAB3523336.1 phosphatidate cytidylyltransferase [Corynebacterium zhongnanshanii]KAB3527949.1 phosphatidate cytidylyltransferase [Corynebacterium sp. 250]
MAAPKPKNGAGRNLKQAIGVGVLLGALVIASLMNPIAWYPLVAIAVGLATYEVWRRLLEAGYVVNLLVCVLGGQAMLWLSLPFGTSGLIAGYVTSVLVLMVTRLFHYGRNSPPHNYVRDVAVGTFIMTWIPLFATFAAMLSRMENDSADGVMFILTFMICVVASDVGGYAFGVFFGSHPMAPAVSPKKSWEGFAGSIVTSMVAGTLCVVFLLEAPFWIGILLGIGLAICATLGDLVESQFKRDLKLKDMSHMLPGHGGLMDRMDGLLPAAMVTWVVLNIISSV